MGSRSDGWSPELQDKMSVFVQAVYEVAGHEPGYGDMALDFRDIAVDVYFHGPMPDALGPVIDQAEAAGVAIRQIATAYGELELRKATTTLGAALQTAGIHWTRMGPAPKYSGLQVAGPEVSVDGIVQKRVHEIAHELIGDIPVNFVPDEGPIFAAAGTFRRTARPVQSEP